MAPELILHYVKTHQYSPPVEFMAALHAVFDQGLEAYKEMCEAAWARVSGDRDPAPAAPPFFVHLLVRLTGDGAPEIIHLLDLECYSAEAELPLMPAAEIIVDQVEAALYNVAVHTCVVNGTPRARHAGPLPLKSNDRIEIGPLRYVYLRASNWMP